MDAGSTNAIGTIRFQLMQSGQHLHTWQPGLLNTLGCKLFSHKPYRFAQCDNGQAVAVVRDSRWLLETLGGLLDSG